MLPTQNYKEPNFIASIAVFALNSALNFCPLRRSMTVKQRVYFQP